MSVTAGTRIGPYEIVAPIGAGGMGEVYRARDPRLSRDVAIKVLPPAFAADPDRLRRFEEEARAAGQLNHPNVLTVYDVGAHDPSTGSGQAAPYIVSELLEGRTVRSVLEDGPLSVRDALDVARQIAEGLAAAHDKGIVHRDLKPENLFLTTDRRLKILDFGIAKLTRPRADSAPEVWERATETVEGTVLGTAGYMSPEQLRGLEVDRRSDLFSFGAILYELLTGRRAFLRATAADTASAILNEDPGLPATMPRAVRTLVMHCLEKTPAARFQSAHDLAFDLEALRAGMANVRHLPAWTYAAALVVAVAAIVAWFVGGGRTAGPTAIGAGGRPALAIMSFDNPSGASDIAWLTHGIPSMLVTGLAQTKGLDVISASRLEEVGKAAGYGDTAHLDRARWRDVARRAGAGALVGGSVFKAAGNLRVDVSVEELGSGRVIAAHSVHGADVFPLVDDVAARIVQRIGVDAANVDTHAIADITTRSIEAYRLYSEALVARNNLRLTDARDLFEKAVAIDPQFALAYVDLALATRNLRDSAASQRYGALALQHLDRLPPRQRMLVQLTSLYASGDARKAIEIGERLTAQYPDEAEGFHMLAHAYADLADAERALRTWEAAVRLHPEAGNMHNEYGYTLFDAGRYDDAMRQFEEYRRLNPREPNPYDSLGEARIALGEPTLALEAYGTALTIDPQFVESYAGRAWAFSMLGQYDAALTDAERYAAVSKKRNAPQSGAAMLRAWLLSRIGRYRDAAVAIETGRTEAVRVDDAEGQANADLLTAVIALERGQLDPALSAAERALTFVPALRDRVRASARAATQFVAGAAEARSGALDAARRRVQAGPVAAAHTNRAELWWSRALDVEIALAARSPAAAAAAMAAAPTAKMSFSMGYGSLNRLVRTLPVHDTAARVRLALGDRGGAIAAYRELLTQSRHQQWVVSLEPRFVLALARLLDETGDAAGARAEYERFAALWKSADSGLPEVEEVRRRLRR